MPARNSSVELAVLRQIHLAHQHRFSRRCGGAKVLCWATSRPCLLFKSIRKADSLHHLLEARVVAQRFHKGIYFHEANKLVSFVDCFVE